MCRVWETMIFRYYAGICCYCVFGYQQEVGFCAINCQCFRQDMWSQLEYKLCFIISDVITKEKK